MLYADGGQFGTIQQPCTSPTVVRLSGLSELVPLRWHPESVPAMPMCVSPLGGLRAAGWRIASLARSGELKSPTGKFGQPIGLVMKSTSISV